MDPIDYITSQSASTIFSQSFMCKQELEAVENLNYVHCDQYVQLPQLESPSLPTTEIPSTKSLVSSSENNDQEDDLQGGRNINNNKRKNNNNDVNKVTDWRALDKFVASQLSHEDQYGLGEGLSSSFEGKVNSDFPLMFMEGGREEEDGGGGRLNGLLSSANQDNCDIGICIFDK
ncbi:hypothetical protein L2E82_43648 [Cichorium intybus]|nr:hypothetical protein L2E82_43648 [Cichorium intybus]